MSTPINITPEIAEHWDRLADMCEPEYIPSDIPEVGGFLYFVMPESFEAPRYGFGGYDATNEETTDIESLILVSPELPRHVRGLMVAHLVLHKGHDEGSPHMCGDIDKSIQHVLAEAEPSLIEPFYDENKSMYGTSLGVYIKNPQIPRLIIDRYKRGLEHAETKHSKATAADDRRKRLEDAGLVFPDGDTALTGVDKRSGQRTLISLQTERGEKHKCRDCGHHIPKGTQRVTTSTEQKSRGYDHHHYHPGCFSHIELGVFGALQQA